MGLDTSARYHYLQTSRPLQGINHVVSGNGLRSIDFFNTSFIRGAIVAREGVIFKKYESYDFISSDCLAINIGLQPNWANNKLPALALRQYLLKTQLAPNLLAAHLSQNFHFVRKGLRRVAYN